MRFEREVQEQYLKAFGKGSSGLRKNRKQGGLAQLQVLDAILDQQRVACQIDLGVVEIPVSQIVGVTTADGKELLYSPDFMPLSSPKSPYAKEWRQLYLAYLSGEGPGTPIRCYEYLGRFYVHDGAKRVSVLKSHGAPTISSQVIRIMPKHTAEKNIQCYYEFLHHFHLTGLYQISFTQPEYFAKLQAALGHETNYRWNDTDRFGFLFHWHAIETAFQKAYDGYLNITAADALVILLERYSYSQIIKMPVWVLARVFEAHWKRMHELSFPELAQKRKNTQVSEVLQTA